MAIIEEYIETDPRCAGAHVTILDDGYRDASPEELQRRYENFERVCRRILINAARRKAQENAQRQRADSAGN